MILNVFVLLIICYDGKKYCNSARRQTMYLMMKSGVAEKYVSVVQYKYVLEG